MGPTQSHGQVSQMQPFFICHVAPFCNCMHTIEIDVASLSQYEWQPLFPLSENLMAVVATRVHLPSIQRFHFCSCATSSKRWHVLSATSSYHFHCRILHTKLCDRWQIARSLSHPCSLGKTAFILSVKGMPKDFMTSRKHELSTQFHIVTACIFQCSYILEISAKNRSSFAGISPSSEAATLCKVPIRVQAGHLRLPDCLLTWVKLDVFSIPSLKYFCRIW